MTSVPWAQFGQSKPAARRDTPHFRSRVPSAGTALLLGPWKPGPNGCLHSTEFTFILLPKDTPQITPVCVGACGCSALHVCVSMYLWARAWVHWLPSPALTDAPCLGSQQFLNYGKRGSLRILMAEPDLLVCVSVGRISGNSASCCGGEGAREKRGSSHGALQPFITHLPTRLRPPPRCTAPCTGPLAG